MFVEGWVGIAKWQFAVVLAAVTLALGKRQPLFLLLTLVAYDPLPSKVPAAPDDIAIISTHISIEEKWDRALQPKQYGLLLSKIDHAITMHKKVVILPESVFPLFLNRQPILFEALKKRAKKINIVTGALYWDGKSPKNSTYIFTRDGNVTIANKVILVPFGERNPLPDFLSKWVNRIFYDDAVDYTADKHVTDYAVEGITYRNAICFEATSERLYVSSPKQMIVLSNNGWFVPSTEPTLQRLLLQYYSRKYGTTIYHAVNMSDSYMIVDGHPVKEQP
jgi:apolipoprotein N-acyltransferase